MAEKSTFIKLDRNILNWRWYKNPNTFRLFVHLLLKANIKDHQLEQYTIKRGEVVVSVQSLSDALGITPSQVRIALGHLKSTGEITSRPTNRFQVITIVNYDYYQGDTASKNATGKQTESNHNATGQQRYNNDNNDKNEKNIYSSSQKKNSQSKSLKSAFMDGVTIL